MGYMPLKFEVVFCVLEYVSFTVPFLSSKTTCIKRLILMKTFCNYSTRHNIKRIIAVTSWCTKPGPNNPWFIEWFLKPFIIGANLRDMAIMEDLLEAEKPDEINYTIVRPPGLTLGRFNSCLKGYC